VNEFFTQSVYFGAVLSVGAYLFGLWLKKKTGIRMLNPLLTAVALCIVLLLVLDVDYETYNAGAKYISYLLTPATICLAVPLYEQFEKLRQNSRAILAGILSGVITSLVSVLALALLFRLDYANYVTLLPKSITTAIGIGVTEKLGGYPAITAAIIILTGNLGNIFADGICRLCRITDPIAKGIAIGTSSHAIGTTRALEMGPVEGAMSSLSIVVAGLLTVIGAGLFAPLL